MNAAGQIYVQQCTIDLTALVEFNTAQVIQSLDEAGSDFGRLYFSSRGAFERLMQLK